MVHNMVPAFGRAVHGDGLGLRRGGHRGGAHNRFLKKGHHVTSW